MSVRGLDEELRSYYSGRTDVPEHVRLQIGEKLRNRGEAESSGWVGVMVLCSLVCMLVFVGASWMVFGWVALLVLLGIYYFMTVGAAVSALLFRRVSL